MAPEFDFLKRVDNLLVFKLLERINILSDGSLDQKWLLRNVGDTFSEFVQADLL